MLRVCHVIASINARTGGPAVSVTRLAAAEAKLGASCSLWTQEYPDLGSPESAPRVRIVSSKTSAFSRRLRGLSLKGRSDLFELGAEVDLVHNHGLWMFPNLYARQAAERRGVPLVISPRGMLESWALRRSRWKKRLAWQAFERGNLRRAALFHATAPTEAMAIRQLGFKQPIAVVGNGVEIPDLRAAPGRELIVRRFPELGGKRWLLFLSRLHPVKGIEELIHCWSQLHRQFSDWHLIIAGPSFGDYGSDLKDLVRANDLEHRVTFTGMLENDLREAALANADLFVLPSHSESFGLAVAEAFAFGVPVVTTRKTPWSEIVGRRCGWWVDDNAKSLGVALTEAMSLEPGMLKEMGTRGRDWMTADYSWDQIARRLLETYNWVLGGGERPEWVTGS